MLGWNGWEWTLGGLVMGSGMLLMWVVPIALIVLAMTHFNKRKTPEPPERAIDILEKAYARGEISREEFLQKRDDLLGNMERK